MTRALLMVTLLVFDSQAVLAVPNADPASAPAHASRHVPKKASPPRADKPVKSAEKHDHPASQPTPKADSGDKGHPNSDSGGASTPQANDCFGKKVKGSQAGPLQNVPCDAI